MIKSLMKYILLCTFSGYVYVCLELLYRGHSDVSMMFCASVCAIPMIILNNIFTYNLDFLFQVFTCSFFTTMMEWITGIIINKDYHIWDYRHMFLHSPDGQICVPFMVVWAVIAATVIPLMDWIDWCLFDYMPETPPYYKIGGKIIYRMKKEE